MILGNHDDWAASWMAEGEALMGWHREGGAGTVASYARRAGVDPPTSPFELLEHWHAQRTGFGPNHPGDA